MSKLRSDSKIGELAAEQQELINGWLFEENLSYAETVKRMKKELGLEASLSAVGRYYRAQALHRQERGMLDAWGAALVINGSVGEVVDFKEAALKLVGMLALKVTGDKPGDVKQLAACTKLLLANEQNQLRRDRLKLAKQRFEFEGTVAAEADVPRVRAYLEAVREDPDLSHEEKMKRMRNFLFGWRKWEQAGAELDLNTAITEDERAALRKKRCREREAAEAKEAAARKEREQAVRDAAKKVQELVRPQTKTEPEQPKAAGDAGTEPKAVPQEEELPWVTQLLQELKEKHDRAWAKSQEAKKTEGEGSTETA